MARIPGRAGRETLVVVALAGAREVKQKLRKICAAAPRLRRVKLIPLLADERLSVYKTACTTVCPEPSRWLALRRLSKAVDSFYITGCTTTGLITVTRISEGENKIICLARPMARERLPFNFFAELPGRRLLFVCGSMLKIQDGRAAKAYIDLLG